MPRALQQLAGGEEWVAVTVPERLPQLQTWLPYLRPRTEEERATLRRVRELEAGALRARQEGRVLETRLLNREATRLAVVSLTEPPEPRVIEDGIAAVDVWVERVRRDTDLSHLRGLAAAHDSVRTARRRIGLALASGDTTSAVLYLAEATEIIQEQAPSAVALRVIARAQERLRARGQQGQDVSRAIHLLSAARQELLAGDAARALQRALYALQLADGKGLRAAPVAADPQGVCYEPPCESP